MDWMQQSLDMMKSWSDMQKKMWEGWVDAASGLGQAQGNPMDEWVGRWQETVQKSMDVWEDLARSMVETETTWAGSQAAAGVWPGREDDVRKMSKVWAEQTTNLMTAWAEAQRALWNAWFNVASSMAKAGQGPGTESFDQWQEAARTSMDHWEELSRKAMESQAEWLRSWLKTTEKAAAGAQPEQEKQPDERG